MRGGGLESGSTRRGLRVPASARRAQERARAPGASDTPSRRTYHL
jgi:hypothetical protein